MARINVADLDKLAAQRYRWARVLEVHSDWDTADIELLDAQGQPTGEQWQDVPLFYHCTPDAQLRPNGALEGAAAAFEANCEVIVELDGFQEVKRVVARRDGLRTCAAGELVVRVAPYVFVFRLKQDDEAQAPELQLKDWWEYELTSCYDTTPCQEAVYTFPCVDLDGQRVLVLVKVYTTPTSSGFNGIEVWSYDGATWEYVGGLWGAFEAESSSVRMSHDFGVDPLTATVRLYWSRAENYTDYWSVERWRKEFVRSGGTWHTQQSYESGQNLSPLRVECVEGRRGLLWAVTNQSPWTVSGLDFWTLEVVDEVQMPVASVPFKAADGTVIWVGHEETWEYTTTGGHDDRCDITPCEVLFWGEYDGQGETIRHVSAGLPCPWPSVMPCSRWNRTTQLCYGDYCLDGVCHWDHCDPEEYEEEIVSRVGESLRATGWYPSLWYMDAQLQLFPQFAYEACCRVTRLTHPTGGAPEPPYTNRAAVLLGQTLLEAEGLDAYQDPSPRFTGGPALDGRGAVALVGRDSAGGKVAKVFFITPSSYIWDISDQVWDAIGTVAGIAPEDADCDRFWATWQKKAGPYAY